MKHANNLFRALGIDPSSRKQLQEFSRRSQVSIKDLRWYNESNSMPSNGDLERICTAKGITPTELMLHLGHIDSELRDAIQKHAHTIFQQIEPELKNQTGKGKRPCPPLAHKTKFGELYQGDCLDLMSNLESEQFDLIFADPPFNLNKMYPSGIDDNLKESRYIEWTEGWLAECVRLLKPGGSLFVWNLPRWNTYVASFLNGRLTFRHWIATDIKFSLPIQSRLYPSHYSLLYYCKGEKPARFHPDRLPMQVCPSCAADLVDYGGYKDKMNPKGVNLTDVWYDIPPVRHAKYKHRKEANELSIKLLDRVIELASDEGDSVFDPFGGAGTTYLVAELKRRSWVGIEIGPVDDIILRLNNQTEEKVFLQKIRSELNTLFTDGTLQRRRQRGLWDCESVRRPKSAKLR